MNSIKLASLHRAVRGFATDTDAVILPYVTVMLVVFIGVAALALDGTRAMSLQTQMQKAADALAIAGAAELDRLTTSTGRAYSAVITNPMVTNSSLFGGNVAVANVRFLATLPASDSTPITAVLCTNNTCTSAQSVQARFIEVTVTPMTLGTIMPTQFVNATMGPIATGGSAVAGMDQVNCGLTPLFICNPFEQTGDSYDQATQRLEAADLDATFKRQLIRLSDPGPSGTWGPGDFGYLVPEPGTLPTDSCFSSAGSEIGKAIASDTTQICVRQNGVDLQPGNANAAKDGLNSRFGLYPNSFGSTCRSAYPPDRNVRKGMKPAGGGGWCTAVPDGQDSGGSPDWPPGPNPAHALGVDNCLIGSNSCSPNANIGASSWDCATYWAVNHTQLNPTHTAPGGCTTTATISRYDVYQYELDNNYQGDAANTTVVADRETGTPQCTGPTPAVNRRILNVAIVNCGSSPVAIQSNAVNVPVAAFGKFFLTHAVTNQTRPYAEFRGLLDRGLGTSVLKDQVQLFR